MKNRIFFLLTKETALFFFTTIISINGLHAQQPDWNQYAGPKAKIAAIHAYGKECLKKQKFDEAVRVFSTGYEIAQHAGLDSLAAAEVLMQGIAYRYKTLFDSTAYCLRIAQKIANQHHYPSLQAAIKLEYFAIYNRLGKTDSAAAVINNLQAMIPRLDSLGIERAKIELYLGHNDKHKAKYSDALQHYYQALHVFSYLGDTLNMGNSYISMANVLVVLGRQDQALSYHQQTAALFIRMGRKYELANELLNITDMYYTSGRVDSAEITVKQALQIATELGEKYFMAFAYMHLGNINKLRKKYTEAENYFLRSIRLGEQINMAPDLLENYQGLGEMYMAEGQPAKAKKYLEKNLLLVKQNSTTEEIIEATKDMAENEYALHNYAKAYEFQKLLTVYKDSAYTASVSKSTAEMESKYQNEKKEQEIALLKKDQELKSIELQKQRTTKIAAFIFIGLLAVIGFLAVNRYRVIQKAKRLIEIEKLRNNIARDLHDDIGSTLTSINILSKVALQQANEGAVTNANLQKIKDRSSTIMESMSDIVWAINPQNDTVEKMILRMKEFTAEILEPLNISYVFNDQGNFAAVKLGVDKRKDFYLIFKEALNNAAKYSDCHTIHIDLLQDQQSICLKVTDDGKGFDTRQSGSGNGLRNMQERAAAMQARVQVHTSSGRGTTIQLEVPIT